MMDQANRVRDLPDQEQESPADYIARNRKSCIDVLVGIAKDDRNDVEHRVAAAGWVLQHTYTNVITPPIN